MSLIPGPDVYLEFRMLGTIISAIAYGIVISLSGNCFLLLLKKRGIYSTRMRLFLLTYVAVMLLLSTLATIMSIWGITFVLFQGVDLPSPHFISSPLLDVYSPTALPLTIWGADGFMVCKVFVTFIALPIAHEAQACGVMMFLSLTADDILATVLILFSTLVNIILAALIILRLIHHQRHIRKVLGAQHGSPYSKIITMCVESSALIVIFSGVYSVISLAEADGPSELIPFLLLPHICVISPLLIVYRVAKGRAVTTTLHPSEEVTAQIRFNDQPSSRSNQEEGEA
ncbi:hypothetical protein M413DRAFT_25866 [Hebeloma cylindrosporum]|uniref:G-protein coupled receptors family 1 profile domain-containing protein n=1 Tax=Hebeloma cylindrosporum TaxID=76867 RepID=A0A0C2Y0X6_HEBCY|nr:hypothetical protein M413DRAFT_25866 [Hebeloma cylindrosporum h7]